MSIILTCNVGSTNTKLAAFDAATLERRGHAVTHGAAETEEWLCSIGSLGIRAIGHRVVHGGLEYAHPETITDRMLARLESFVPLAPLHQPAALRLIARTRRLYPDVPHIACFDTAFHHTQSELEHMLPLPRWYAREGVRRYGFHGLSYHHIASRLPDVLGEQSEGRVLVAHLGGGSSACAIHKRRSVASTMGFSTLDGMMMSTRSGALDPGALLYMLRNLGLKLDEVERLLYLESGLRGVSGISGDMRELLASGTPEAREAIALYCHAAAKQMASLLPALGGIDALVFTGGIGEHAAPVRAAIAERLGWLGISLSATLNDAHAHAIHSPESRMGVYIIPSDEESVIAQASANATKDFSTPVPAGHA